MDLETKLMDWVRKNMSYLLLNEPTIHFTFPSDLQNDLFKIGVLELFAQEVSSTHKYYFIGLELTDEKYEFMGTIAFPKDSKDVNDYLRSTYELVSRNLNNV